MSRVTMKATTSFANATIENTSHKERGTIVHDGDTFTTEESHANDLLALGYAQKLDADPPEGETEQEKAQREKAEIEARERDAQAEAGGKQVAAGITTQNVQRAPTPTAAPTIVEPVKKA